MRASWKRFTVAALVAWVSATIIPGVLGATILRRDFLEGADYLRPVDEVWALMPVGRLALLIAVVSYGVIMRYLLKEISVRSGLLLGCALGAAIFAGATLGMYAMVPWPPRLLLAQGIVGTLNTLLTCTIFGAMCRAKVASGVTTSPDGA